ncbi:schlafen family member 1-like [Meriones unguiculatus]|uniref:schlafen family member 1-like n=1 Tax=Meriones unguiculatus TaxID=10047 RepID=UPI000B4F8B6D|nr:schlafen family member 1-like [Meriones unguiculatus]
MAAGEMSIIIESKTPELVLNVGKITLPMKNRKRKKDDDRTQQNTKILRALCALQNSGGGEIKAQIENQDCSLTTPKIRENLETFLNAVTPSTWKLHYKLEGCYLSISVKPENLETSGEKPATIATNLYTRNGTSSHPMDLDTALTYFEGMGDTSRRVPLENRVKVKSSREGVQEEGNVQELAAAFFDQTRLTKMEEFSFSESKNVEYKSFATKKWFQRVKEILPQTVSAFANTDGGYLFIGLDENMGQIIGCEAKKGDLTFLESEIEKCIQELPVMHICEEKENIKYTCKFIEVHDSSDVCSYVCALRVERFCCAVFTAEPDSWHVEDGCVKKFTMEEWVKRLMMWGARLRSGN